MKLFKSIKHVFIILSSTVLINTFTEGFVTNANRVINSEQRVFNEILQIQNLPCHLQSVRVKTFESTIQKMKKMDISDVYDIYDLVGFRYVFYTKDDLLKFYHHVKVEKTVWYSINYLTNPKKNEYSAMHIRYRNDYNECPIKQLECQLFLITDYYNSIYGNAGYDKNYTLYF